MGRLFFFIAIAFVIYLLVKAFRKHTPPQHPAATEDMVRCAQCGVHLPKSESVRAQDRDFCCAAHRDAYRQ